ncbi:MAG: hypothetical protein HOA30_10100 [Rhodospirillaceae bacterium]|nr:hypothetical protein [Rhodospirillaceae bacterium]
MKNLDIRIATILLVVLIIGIAGNIAVGHRAKVNAVETWRRQATLDVAITTEFAQAWVGRVQGLVRGIAVRFRTPDAVAAAEFEDLVLNSEDWDSDFFLTSVAYARRVPRNQRDAYETALGLPVTDITERERRAPTAYESFVVELSSDPEGLFPIGGDLITREVFNVVAATAYRVPKVIMGPAFKGPRDKLHVLVGIKVRNGEHDGVLVGTADLSELIAKISQTTTPIGIRLRMAERDIEASEATETSLLRPIHGDLAPAQPVDHTITIRMTSGQARWELYWDVLPTYLGGADVGFGQLIQLAGSIIVILVVLMIGFLSVQNSIIRRRIVERTASLQIAKNEAEAASKAKSEFLSSMSHELRTPMNSVLGFAQLLQADKTSNLSEKQTRAVHHIRRSGSHLLDLINQVLELSKIEAEEININETDAELSTMVNECVSLMEARATERGIKIDSGGIAGGVYIRTDPTRFKQVLLNLLSNAIKYNRDAGSVIISRDLQADGMVRIAVADTGPGIPEALQPQLFEPFNRLGLESGEIEGTGIGLTICQQIVHHLDARLGFESREGHGSTFWIEVPHVEVAHVEAPLAEPPTS